ncbi:MAG: UDP-N-acetylmuramate--L-alanine ligase [Blautia sp.]|nr:UDP-N-acetylmuramate--L-alanine ligase [Blautia sp.]
MYEIDLSTPAAVHFIGIGGISMSGLAQVLLDKGFAVSGSDTRPSLLTRALEEKGAAVFYPQRASNLPDRLDAVIYTAAINPENPEYQAALSRGVPMLTRAQLLGQIMKGYGTSIAVAGTHGKTTTTSMLAHILMEAQCDPTISVGGILPSIGGNIRVGKSDVFLTEACEYTNSFLSFFPTLGIILNMDADHLDFFKDIDDIRHSFARFAHLLPPEGTLVINADTPCHEQVTEGLPCHVVTYGLDNEADYTACDITWDKYGHASFTVRFQGKKIGSFYLKVPGLHNVSNALAAIAAARVIGLDTDVITRGLGSFTGTQRRFEYKGQIGEVTIIDDYAHHPTEIAATLRAAAVYPHRRLWCVFQPHTYTRTKALLDEFAQALSAADEVVLADIYAAREHNDIGITSEDLKVRIEERGTSCAYFPTFDEIEQYLLSRAQPGDVILTMGAGDVVKVGEHILGL